MINSIENEGTSSKIRISISYDQLLLLITTSNDRLEKKQTILWVTRWTRYHSNRKTHFRSCHFWKSMMNCFFAFFDTNSHFYKSDNYRSTYFFLFCWHGIPIRWLLVQNFHKRHVYRSHSTEMSTWILFHIRIQCITVETTICIKRSGRFWVYIDFFIISIIRNHRIVRLIDWSSF